jgi:hypothetical protein
MKKPADFSKKNDKLLIRNKKGHLFAEAALFLALFN